MVADGDHRLLIARTDLQIDFADQRRHRHGEEKHLQKVDDGSTQLVVPVHADVFQRFQIVIETDETEDRQRQVLTLIDHVQVYMLRMTIALDTPLIEQLVRAIDDDVEIGHDLRTPKQRQDDRSMPFVLRT